MSFYIPVPPYLQGQRVLLYRNGMGARGRRILLHQARLPPEIKVRRARIDSHQVHPRLRNSRAGAPPQQQHRLLRHEARKLACFRGWLRQAQRLWAVTRDRKTLALLRSDGDQNVLCPINGSQSIVQEARRSVGSGSVGLRAGQLFLSLCSQRCQRPLKIYSLSAGC